MRILVEFSPSETTAQIELEEAVMKEALKGEEVSDLRAFLESNQRRIIEVEAGQGSLSYNPVTGCARVEVLAWPSEVLHLYQATTAKAKTIIEIVDELDSLFARLKTVAKVLKHIPFAKRLLLGRLSRLIDELEPLFEAYGKFIEASLTPKKETESEEQHVA